MDQEILHNPYLFAYGLGCRKSDNNLSSIHCHSVYLLALYASTEEITYSASCDPYSSRPHGICCLATQIVVSFSPGFLTLFILFIPCSLLRKLTLHLTIYTGPFGLIIRSLKQEANDLKAKLGTSQKYCFFLGRSLLGTRSSQPGRSCPASRSLLTSSYTINDHHDPNV